METDINKEVYPTVKKKFKLPSIKRSITLSYVKKPIYSEYDLMNMVTLITDFLDDNIISHLNLKFVKAKVSNKRMAEKLAMLKAKQKHEEPEQEVTE